MSSGRDSPPFSFSISRNFFVPDDAMVPRFCSSSAASMPMPLSEIISVFAPLSAAIWIFHSGLSWTSALSVSERNFARSIASDAFEMSSRRNISFFE